MPGHLLLTNCIEDKVSRPSIEIGSLTAFVVFGLGTEALAVVGLLVLFRRRGWMGRKS